MGNIKFTKGTGIPHRSFEEEFLSHDKCSEWWYCTGYLRSEAEDRLFGYQFTLAKVRLVGLKFHLLICSVTDFAAQKHYNIQTPIFFRKGITANNQLIAVGDQIRVELKPTPNSTMGSMKLHMEGTDFSLDTEMEAVKPPVWHCEDGVLKMGVQNDPKERTYYYSFTNLATKGKLMLNGKEYANLTGKTWFDRQGGTYTLTKNEASWEWFSIRFFDNSEAMLFMFPQTGYQDGTRIAADGSYHRLNEYQVTATGMTEYNNMKFSKGWKLSMEGKQYTLEPMADGMFNVFFFELLASVVDDTGKEVGYCFVELLPGARNKKKISDAFKRKK